MIIDGEDVTKVARREYGRMITALYAEPFGNAIWAQNVVTAWQKLDPRDPMRGILHARIAYGLPIERIAEIWGTRPADTSEAIGIFMKGIHRGYDEDQSEELYSLW